MIVGSIKEDKTLEKRVSITPESAKNIIGLGLKVCIEKGYALHLGIDDKEFDMLREPELGACKPGSLDSYKKKLDFQSSWIVE